MLNVAIIFTILSVSKTDAYRFDKVNRQTIILVFINSDVLIIWYNEEIVVSLDSKFGIVFYHLSLKVTLK